jgi:uncharacterized protein (DUF2236 family)
VLPGPLDDVVEPLRRQLGASIRSRVSGTGDRAAVEAAAAAFFRAEGPRWYGPGDAVWIVHADVSMFVGGLRALLLQSLHPLAMAGVAQHSDYRTDPWGRLQRTAQFLGQTTYGSAAQAEAACATVRRVHKRVRGVAPDGRPYAANDPHLLAWVHVVEVDSFLRAHRHYGRVQLDDGQRDQYVAQMAKVARTLGVVDPPTTVMELRTALDAYRPELRSTSEARESARFLLAPPQLPLAARPVYGLLFAGAATLLPLWARISLRVPWLPVAERVLVRPAAQVLVDTMRWALGPPPTLAEESVTREP